jgi:hypothetical protein
MTATTAMTAQSSGHDSTRDVRMKAVPPGNNLLVDPQGRFTLESRTIRFRIIS